MRFILASRHSHSSDINVSIATDAPMVPLDLHAPHPDPYDMRLEETVGTTETWNTVEEGVCSIFWTSQARLVIVNIATGEVEDPNAPRRDDIWTEYIPNSKRSPEISHFEDYVRFRQSSPIPTDDEPWKPGFETVENFEFAEICLEGSLNMGLCKRLINLMHKCIGGGGKFTLSSVDDLRSSWRIASRRLTGVRYLLVNYCGWALHTHKNLAIIVSEG